MPRPPSRLPYLLGALGGAVALLILVFGAGVVLRGNGTPDDVQASDPVTTEATDVDRGPSVGVGTAVPVGPSSAPLPVVPVQALDSRHPGPSLTVDRLSSDSVVHIEAAGFEPLEAGWVEQCVSELNQVNACTGRFPVQFDEDGAADFQYLTQSAALPGGCRYALATCSLQVAGARSGRRGSVQVVVGAAPRGLVRVEPRAGLRDGQAASVDVARFPAETEALAVLCEVPGGYDVRHCGREALGRLHVGADGSGRAEFVVRTGSIGADAVRCGPRDPCGVLVVTEAGYVATPTVPLQFSLGPGASYDGSRLAVGLALAGVFVLTAIALIRRTDWTKPTEAATPEVDAADLETGKSLDELFGTDEELDQRDPIPF